MIIDWIKATRLDTGNDAFGQLASNGEVEVNLQVKDEDMRENFMRTTEDQKRRFGFVASINGFKG